MDIARRDVLKAGLALSFATALTTPRAALAEFAPQPSGWRTFELTTRLEIAAKSGMTRAWVPLPSVFEGDWVRPLGNLWTTNGHAVQDRDPEYKADMLSVAWSPSESSPVVEVTSRFQTRDRRVDLSRPGDVPPLDAETRALSLKPTALIPTDGIIKDRADAITAGAESDLEKCRKIYDWTVANTYREPKVRGCGTGNILSLLTTNNHGGKCGDINSLFVGLCRASGIPARDIFGIRVAPSRFGYKALGANSPTVSKAQHCRAEAWLEGFGWVPIDPADVTKVIREETAEKLPADDPRVVAAREGLFGSWETNWLPYNFAHDVQLPGSQGAPIGFLMYPEGESAEAPLDALDPDTFKYVITSRELTSKA